MDEIEVIVCQTDDAKDLPIPSYVTIGAAGLDLYANITEDITLELCKRKKIKTGLRVAIPVGYEVQIRPRSGLADRYGITVLNSPGTIDSDYRGEMGVLLINFGEEPLVIKRGERIAQMVVNKIEHVRLTVKNELPETARGTGGFGSTGI